MTRPTSKAPSWLFSFVDLSMLLLIALVQLDAGALDYVELGEIDLPRIAVEQTRPLKADAGDGWQLRVQPRRSEADDPFELLRLQGTRVVSVERLGSSELGHRLRSLREASGNRPLLTPHRRSSSADLLSAVAAIDSIWPGARSATVAPVSARR